MHDDVYTAQQWNEDYNFLVDCLQFYLALCPHNVIMEAPLRNVEKRINIAKMGQQFNEWATVYFSENSENVDFLLPKIQAHNDFKSETGNKMSPIRFKRALQAFADNVDYIECLNPKDLISQSTVNRIMRKIDGKTTEMIYFKTIWKDVVVDDEFNIV